MNTKEMEKNPMPFDGLHEECGVFGMYDFDGGDVASTIYYGLFALQHRGQESCGLAVSDTKGERGNVKFHKDLGLVSEVLRQDVVRKYEGDIGIGHVRYSTTGASVAENAQPLVLSYVKGTLALAHNGNLVNTPELKWELIQNGAIFHTTTDSEVIAFHIARERVHSKTVEEAVLKTAKKIKGAYALVVTSPRKLIGARDPFGLKPLCIGKRDNTYFLASESCAIAAVGGEFVRDVEPGEIVSFTKHGMKSDKMHFQPIKTAFFYLKRQKRRKKRKKWGKRCRQTGTGRSEGRRQCLPGDSRCDTMETGPETEPVLS